MPKKYVQARGCDNLVYAKVLTDTKEAFETGEVKDLAAVKSVATERAQSSEKVFADNISALVVNSAIETTRTFEVMSIGNAELADITGQYYEETSDMII